MSMAMILCNNLAVQYGDNIVAGMGVAAKIMTIGTFIFMGFAAGCQPLVGAQMLATTTVQAMGKGVASLILSVARQGLFYIPILFTLNKVFAFHGLIYAQPIADVFTLTLSLIVLSVILKKSMKEKMEEKEVAIS